MNFTRKIKFLAHFLQSITKYHCWNCHFQDLHEYAFLQCAIKSGDTALALDTLNVWNQQWNKDHADILHLAAESGEIEICKNLVKENGFPVDVYDTSGETNREETVVHLAAKNGHLEVIKYFHEECNCDLNAIYSEVKIVFFVFMNK